jgi:hypothetical protein
LEEPAISGATLKRATRALHTRERTPAAAHDSRSNRSGRPRPSGRAAGAFGRERKVSVSPSLAAPFPTPPFTGRPAVVFLAFLVCSFPLYPRSSRAFTWGLDWRKFRRRTVLLAKVAECVSRHVQ